MMAQIPEVPWGSLGQAGFLGAIVCIMFYREFRRDERDNKREEKRDEQMTKLTASIQHLVRITSIEVLSRPNIQKRTSDEAREIHTSVSQPMNGTQ